MIDYAGKQLAAAFRTVRNNTVQTALDIPEDRYSWSPAEGSRTIGALLAHIAVSPMLQEEMHRHQRVTTLKGFDFGGLIGKMSAESAKQRSKAELVELLRTEGERFAAWLESLTPEFLAEQYTDPMGANPRTRFEGLLSAKEHEMHHRGQLMLIERLLGIVPHLTRQMAERMAAHAAATAKV